MNILTLKPYEGKEITSGRKMRLLCGCGFAIVQVNIWRTPGAAGPAGILQISFGAPCQPFETVRENWQSLSVLANALRNWRNLRGAPLIWEGLEAGKVSPHNAVLVELSK